MKNQVLTIKQINILKSLGFDIEKYSSMCWLGSNLLPKEDGMVKCFCETTPTMTIGDIINILPTHIEENRYELMINKNSVKYYSYLLNDCIFEANLSLEIKTIDALFCCLKWCIDNKYL